MESYQEYNASDLSYYDFTNFTDYPDYPDYAYPNEHVLQTAKTVYIAFAILSAVINTVLLLTAISKAARSCSVCWYMYHLTFVTVIQTIIELVFVCKDYQGLTHVQCMFLHIAYMASMPINCYNVILMDVELILSLAPNSNGAEPILTLAPNTNGVKLIRRFLITTISTWTVSVIFSVIAHFVGNIVVSITNDGDFCLTVPGIARTISLAMAQRIPLVIICVCVWFVIRSTRQPAIHVIGAEDPPNRSFKNELYVICILWSGFECFQILVQFLMAYHSESNKMPYAFIGDKVCYLIHFYLPVLSLILGSVRMAIKNAWLFVLKN